MKFKIIGYEGCSFYSYTLSMLQRLQKKYPAEVVIIKETMKLDDYREWLRTTGGEYGPYKLKDPHKSSPFVTVDGKYLGSADATTKFIKEWQLLYESHEEDCVDTVEPEEHSYDYDLLVLGGGSGGLAAAKAAAGYLGDKGRVCVVDYVRPTPHGTTWGLGGTCVNVGCIPKKLFHTAAMAREWRRHGCEYGLRSSDGSMSGEEPPMEWSVLRGNVQEHIKTLNHTAEDELRSAKVTYKNARGRFVDPHTVELTDQGGNKSTVTARRFIIAVGGRPKYPDVPGAKEYGITSDDLFLHPHPPGKTLVVGASYVALECAGFITGMGYEATVLMRSIPLRGFDQDMAERVCRYMEETGTAFIREATVESITKSDGKLTVRLSNGAEEQYDTVLFATGREPESGIGMEEAGVNLAESGKIAVTLCERTSSPHIYAIGDVVEGGVELTPVAIRAGRLLAARLYNGSKQLMNYKMVPTTVFTPLEYACCGYTEDEAMKVLKESNIEVYHSGLVPLEWAVGNRPQDSCYVKLIVNKGDGERVVGFHIVCPNAGEVVQGVAVAMMAGVTKHQFDDTVGIHPTIAEVFTTLTITKSSGKDAAAGGC